MTTDPPGSPVEPARPAESAPAPRIPGAVQPHGVLLAVDEHTDGVITHVSANTEEVLGVDPAALLGRPLSELLDETTLARLNEVLGDTDAGNPVPATIGGREFDVIVHGTSTALLVEFEPFQASPSEMIMAIRAALRRLSATKTAQELQDATARELRRITGFDRAMVDHVHPDGHGEVVAEALADDLEPYLGAHYPASDIPTQPRDLSMTKVSRMIVNSSRADVALLADPTRPSAAEPDLSVAELRAASPHHLELMRSRGQTSLLSLSLIRNGVLVGVITCAHRTELRLPYDLRDGLELLANQVSLQLAAMHDIEQLAERNELRELRAALVAQVARAESLSDALLHQSVTLLDFIPADGAAIRLGDTVDSLGIVPELSALTGLTALLRAASAPDDLVSDSLATEYPSLAAALPGVAGLLVRPLGSEGDYLAWFRGEHSGSGTSADADADADTGTGTGTGTDTAPRPVEWQGREREAHELGRDLQAALLHRAEAQLAELALHDPLTGLPNRRLFMDRLEQALLRRKGRGVTLMFVDLDGFKQINDDYGHAEGDEALGHAARALRATARSEDTVARLGGDEFVILCRGLKQTEATDLAQRLLRAVQATPEGAPAWRVDASIGIASVPTGSDAAEALEAADAAMYRAKSEGKGRVSF